MKLYEDIKTALLAVNNNKDAFELNNTADLLLYCFFKRIYYFSGSSTLLRRLTLSG